MAEAEATQTWVSTGRGGAGNFPYTPRALAKRPVTITTPQGREVDYRKQGIAKSGRGGVGYWEPTPDESAKQRASLEFEQDQEIIKDAAIKRRRSILTEGTCVKSGRGGAGNISGGELPTRTPTGQAALDRVYSSGRGGSGNLRYGDAIPMVELNRMETQEIHEVRSRSPSLNAPLPESGLATFAGYASAFFQALTPVENRIENKSPITPSLSSPSKRLPSTGSSGGGGNYAYATYKSKSIRTDGPNASDSTTPIQRASVPPVAGPSTPAKPHVRLDQPYSAYSSSSYLDRSYDPEMPSASGSSSRSYPSTS